MNNIDEEMLLQSKVEFLHAQGLQEMERVWQEVNYQRCRIQDVEARLKLLLISNLDSAIIGDEMLGTHIERAGEVVYLHRCAKMEITLTTLDFCTEEIPVRLGDGKESVINFKNPISNIFYNNYTLTECNPVYPILYQLLNGSWVTYGKTTELARVEPVVFRNSSSRELRPHEFVGLNGNGLFTMEDLVRSNRARFIRHSRTTVTGREVYLGSKGTYSHETLFHLNFPQHQIGFSWGVLPWFQSVKKETLFFWWIAREIAVTILTITSIGRLVRLGFKIFFINRFKRLGTKTRFALQPLNLFYGYNKFLIDVKELKNQQPRSSMLLNDAQNS